MPTFRVAAPDGRTFDVTGPEGSTKEQALERVKSQHEPKAPETAKPTKPPDEHGVMSGAILDTLGMTDRPGAVPLAGTKTTKTPLGVVLKPENAAEVATREAVMAPLTAASLPVRVGVTAATGGLEALTSGKGLNQAAYATILDGITSGLTEGVMGTAGWAAGKVARPLLESRAANETAQRAFAWATQAPKDALDALRARFPGAKVSVPSLASGKITLDEAVERMTKATGPVYQQARDEIAYWMNKLDKQLAPRPKAGGVFRQRTSPERFAPPEPPAGTAAQRAAAQVADAANSPLARTAADVAATVPIEGSEVPVGLALMDRGAGGLAAVARHALPHMIP